MKNPWAVTHTLHTVGAADLARPGVVFRHHHHIYRTVGTHLANGGMGSTFLMERLLEGLADSAGEGDPAHVEPVVGKTFHAQYLYQLRTDEVARRDHQVTLSAVSRVAALEHPSLLPTYISAPIADNHLFVTPRMGDTLLEATLRGKLSHRRRVELLMQALTGLEALHASRLVHRDFTLRNILLDDAAQRAILFDFDLALSFDDIGQVTYRELYRGRIFGSPGYSVPPEILDPAMMDALISPLVDVFAVGGALFALFTSQTPYGDTHDMWGLLVRITEGVVFRGQSRVQYPDAVPSAIRRVVEGCLEREPADRFASVAAVRQELDWVLPELDDTRYDFGSPRTQTLPFMLVKSIPGGARASQRAATDPSVTDEVIAAVEPAVVRQGYELERALGRVKGHPIFLAQPAPALVSSGQFPDANVYPKIVTAIDLKTVADPRGLVEAWLGHFLPTLKSVRQGLLTTLYKVVYDEYSGYLLLFSEWVDEPRFGVQLADEDLTLEEGLGLGLLVVRQVVQLHGHGMAHNNVTAGALLLKGVADSRMVYPAMIGLVEPSLAPAAMADDVRALAKLVLQWIRAVRVEALQAQVRARIDGLRGRLASIAFDDSAVTPPVIELEMELSDGLAAIDYNFAVLRDAGGDLQDYVLLRVSHQLYPRLWKR